MGKEPQLLNLSPGHNSGVLGLCWSTKWLANFSGSKPQGHNSCSFNMSITSQLRLCSIFWSLLGTQTEGATTISNLADCHYRKIRQGSEKSLSGNHMLCSKSESHHFQSRTNKMAPPVNLAFHEPSEENHILVSRNNDYLHSQEQLWTSPPCRHAGLLRDTGVESARLRIPKVATQSFMKIDKTSLDKIFPHENQMNEEEVFPLTRPIWKIRDQLGWKLSTVWIRYSFENVGSLTGRNTVHRACQVCRRLSTNGITKADFRNYNVG